MRPTLCFPPPPFRLMGTSNNCHQSSGAPNLPANDSALFSFRFRAVHSKDVRDCQLRQLFEVPLKQSHRPRTKRKVIANIQQLCSDSPAIANPMGGVFGIDRHSGLASHVPKLALTTASILFASSFDMETVQHAVKNWCQ